MGSGSGLSPRKQAVVAALAAGLSKQEAAETVGVRPQTVSRYMRDPLVQAALRDAQGQVLGQVTRRMTGGANQALDTLQSIMADKTMPPAVRVRAALGWLAEAWRARELNDLEARVAALEAGKNEGNRETN